MAGVLGVSGSSRRQIKKDTNVKSNTDIKKEEDIEGQTNKEEKADTKEETKNNTKVRRDPVQKREYKKQMQEAYNQAVEVVLRGEASIRKGAKRFGLKQSTLYDFVKAAKLGKQKVWTTRGSPPFFSRVEEEELIQLVIHSNPLLTHSELRDVLQNILLRSLAADPGRKLKLKNQEVTKAYVWSFVRKHGLQKNMMKDSNNVSLNAEL